MRTRAKGNVLDAVSYPLGGAVLDNNDPILGSIATADGNGAGVPAFIVAGDATYLFPVGRTFTVTGGLNPGSYTVLAPGAVYNTFPGAPHIANTTEIPAAVTTDVAGSDGTMSGYGIDLDGTLITNSGTPVNSGDLTNKGYVDGALSTIVLGPTNLSPGTYSISITGNAGTVDGLNGSQFLRSDTSDTLSNGSLTLDSSSTRYVSFNDTVGTNNPGIRWQTSGSTNAGALIDNVNSAGNGYLRLYKYTAGGGFAGQINIFEDGNITIDPAGTTTNAGNFNVTGAIVATGNITAYSDVRLKEDIKTIDNAMDKIVQIGGYTFAREDINDGKRYAGVIAQEVQHVLPEVIEQDEDGMLSVAYGNLVALLIEGMKEQRKEILDLKKRIDDLED